MKTYQIQSILASALLAGLLLQGCGESSLNSSEDSMKSDIAFARALPQSTNLYLEPKQESITVSWNVYDGVEYYELNILKENETIATLTFDKDERIYVDYNVNINVLYTYVLNSYNELSGLIDSVKSSVRLLEYDNVKSDEVEL